MADQAWSGLVRVQSLPSASHFESNNDGQVPFKFRGTKTTNRDDPPSWLQMFDDTNVFTGIWPPFLAILVTVLVYLIRPKLGDPYGMFHIELNASESLTDEHEQTEWLNMGYWKVSHVSLVKWCFLS